MFDFVSELVHCKPVRADELVAMSSDICLLVLSSSSVSEAEFSVNVAWKAVRFDKTPKMSFAMSSAFPWISTDKMFEMVMS